jgi:glycosyltransferase involved in cell wall biosynthesis
LYRTADIHVFTVERAAFSVTLLEGMASGLPIITTSWKGHEYMGKAGTHFVTVPFENDRAIEQQLLAYINDPAERRAIGERARAHALSFRWSAIADRILDVYQQVLGERA